MKCSFTVISHIFNEEYYLPAWLTYHKTIFDHGIIIDYHSTDGSLDIVREICPNWTIVQSVNQYFNSELCDKEVQKYENTIQGFKVALNTTEWLIIEDKSIFYTTKPTCFQITPWTVAKEWKENIENAQVSDFLKSFQYIHTSHRKGYRFIHNYPQLNYMQGRHFLHTYPPLSTTNIYIVWCGFFPWNDKVKRRKLQIK